MKFRLGLLWIISFFVVLPLLAQKWVTSPLFFATKDFQAKASDLVEQFNQQRYQKASEYFRNFRSSEKTQRKMSDTFAVVVTTKKRMVCNENEFRCEPHYLQQTLAALHLASRRNLAHSIPIVVCSVDPLWYLDLSEIYKYFPVIFRYNETATAVPSNKEQETFDYAFCLEEMSNRFQSTKYLIAIEDDAIVFEDFFLTLHSIVKERIETPIARGEKVVSAERQWCWMKLYFPEFWSGFGWDANRIWELFWISVAGAMIGSILAFIAGTIKRSSISTIWWSCNGALYLLLAVLIISRPIWLEMRRIHSSLMQVTSDSGCCSTVAVLYPMEEIPTIVNYLRSPKCRRCAVGVDLAIRDYKDRSEMLGLLVQPNLAQHIGLHSTVSSAYKNPVQMLFYDFLSFRF